MLELEIIKENIKNGTNGEILDLYVNPKAEFQNQCISVEPSYRFVGL